MSFGADALPDHQILAFAPHRMLTCEKRAAPTVKKAEISRPNLVAAAVRLAGGPAAVARICGVSRQTIYDWINERRVERLIDALRLSRASSVAIENLAGDDVEKLAAPVQTPRPKRRARRTSPDSPGL
jgi:transposase-like protein